jgi:catechol 2,3-dioxygenase-like lactoylglutathione lyase family enzyme
VLLDVARRLRLTEGAGDNQGMSADIALVALLVRDYDEAIDFYVNALGFKLIEDTPIDEAKRWVVVGPSAAKGTSLLLARAATGDQEERIGDQTGGRVFVFLHTTDFDAQYERMRAAGVTFVGPTRHESYGTVAVFEDLYGNRWDLVQPRTQPGLLASQA